MRRIIGIIEIIGIIGTVAIISALVILFLPAAASAAKMNTVQRGYCCVGGKVVKADEKACLLKMKGRFATSVKEATALCAAPEPEEGYCCEGRGGVRERTRAACEKIKGALFSTDKKKAVAVCRKRRQDLPGLQREMGRQGMVPAQARPAADRTPLRLVPLPRPGGGEGDDERQAVEAPGASASASQRMPEGSVPVIQPGPETSMMDAGALTEVGFPARITRISGTPRPGYAITLHGVDFGSSPGVVKLVADPPYTDGMGTLIVIDWGDERIDVEIPRHIADDLGTSSRPAVIHVWPAGVEADDSGRPPLSTDPEPRYPYSGSEGPMFWFEIEPLIPRISSLSESEVMEGNNLTIRGRDFSYGSHGSAHQQVRITHDGADIPVSVLSWSEDSIRIRIPDAEIGAFAIADGPSELACQLSVVNNLRNESTTRSITIQRVTDVDLGVSYVFLELYHEVFGSPQTCRLYPAVHNSGSDTMWNPIQVRLHNYDGDHWDVTIDPGPGGLAPGATAHPAAIEFDFDGDHRIRVEILTDNANEANDECVIHVDDSGRQNCP